MTDFDKTLQVRIPAFLSDALKCAADKYMMTVAAYVRQTLIMQLKKDGIDLPKNAIDDKFIHDPKEHVLSDAYKAVQERAAQ